MPRRPQPDSFPFRRLLTILTLIPRAPGSTTITEILAALERALELQALPETSVTRETVERNLRQLAEVFDGLRYERSGRAYKWFWDATAAAPAGVPMTPAQGLALSLGHEYLKHHLPRASLSDLAPFFGQAEKAVAAFPLYNRWSRKIRVEGLGFHPKVPAVREHVAARVTEALLHEKQLRVSYLSGRTLPGKPRKAEVRRVHPLGLLLRDGVVTLIFTYVDPPAGPPASNQPEQMHLHRMRGAECLKDARVVPPRFRLADYDLGGGPAIEDVPATLRIRLRVEPGAPFWPEERPLRRQVVKKDEKGNVVEVEADVPNTREFLAWLRGYGPKLKVLAPQELRALLAREVRELAGFYEAR